MRISTDPDPKHCRHQSGFKELIVRLKTDYCYLLIVSPNKSAMTSTTKGGALEEKSRCRGPVLFRFFAIFALKMKLF